MKFITITLLAFLCFNPSARAADQHLDSLQVGTTAPQFSLKDQYDDEFILNNNQDQNLVILIGDRHARGELSRWAKEIAAKFSQNVKIIFIISFPEMPFFLKGWVKNKFKRNSPGNNEKKDRVFIDWAAKVFNQYDCIEKTANIFVIDSKGIIRGIERGLMSDEKIKRVSDAIDRLLKEQ